MLGEIIKSTEALRYHAKSAEIAGKNLAHVNDENYARQRVLAREGLMYNGQGGLNTSSIEAGGLDHARNDLIDKRLFNEFGQTASLEAQQEILKLLQAALGEKIDRQSVDGGLDDEHDSNLSAGGLARAMDDLFNAFQELSASPDAAVSSQEIFNKINTLTKRFNDAGSALDDIDNDLTESVQSAVKEVNKLLSQIEEVNIQIRRFELLGQGKAVSYRDQRQKLLEDLSKLIDFKTSPELREVKDNEGKVTGFEETPFLEIFSTDKADQKVSLLTAKEGVSLLSKEFGNIVLANSKGTNGNGLQIRSKISNDGNLGHVEVIDGGSQYSDLNGPLVLSFVPPLVQSGGENSLVSHSKGSLFSQNGKYYQALSDVSEGTPLKDSVSFLEIDPTKIPSNGDLTFYNETLRKYSDLETFKAGEQIYYNGKLLQVTRDINPITNFQGTELEKRNYQNGEVIKLNDEYFQFLEDVPADSADFDALKNTSLLSIGKSLPQEVDELSYFATALGGEQRFFASKSYNSGDLAKIYDAELNDYRYFEFSEPFLREDELKIGFNVEPEKTGQWILTGPDGTLLAEQVDDPSLGLSKSITLEDGSVIQIEGSFEQAGVEINVVTDRAQSIENFKTNESPMRFRQNEVYYAQQDGVTKHFIVIDPPEDLDPTDFNPFDPQWDMNFKVFNPQLVDDQNPELFFRRSHPRGYESLLEEGSLVELNLGIAEAVINDGQIKGFNILNSGSNLPKSDAVFVEGKELALELGSIKGFQLAKENQISHFRDKLNSLVKSFVEEINGIYNKDDNPGEYLFGFDSVLTRPVVGRNALMEEDYGYVGREGDGLITLYREEVDLQLPVAESETFNIVNVTPVFPEDFKGQQYYVRGEDAAEIDFAPESSNGNYSFYGSARRMQNVTMENDPNFSGADKILGTADDGRSYMMAYSPIPFRLEGMEDGSKLPIIGDNFSFQALLSNPWNLASSLRVQDGLKANSLVANLGDNGEANKIALEIAEMSGGDFLSEVALLNADLGNSLSDLSDNLEHQGSIENVLLDQRRAVSSVSIDEEVADLMRFQRSFQASSRVLNTLDKMLEIVVMGLLK
jgi:flagellar hook-associated protein FlgK